MRKIGKFASEVLGVISNHPIGLTAGEAFLLYQKSYPGTNRSRNEVAKRISELKSDRFVTKRDAVKCVFSGRTATEWGVTSKGVKYISLFPQAFAIVPKTETQAAITALEAIVERQDPYFSQPVVIKEQSYGLYFRVDLADKEKIRLSAYYKFLNRTQNGLPGDELSDWVEAEREYDECIQSIQRCLSLGYLSQVRV